MTCIVRHGTSGNMMLFTTQKVPQKIFSSSNINQTCSHYYWILHGITSETEWTMKNMEKNADRKKLNLKEIIAKSYAGSLAPVALSVISAWMIVIGLKGFAGFTLTQESALADLLGIVIVVGVMRWLSIRAKAK